MIYLRLFLTFFEIGAVSFGGGYGMISLIREIVLANAWLTENDFVDFSYHESKKYGTIKEK